MFVDDVFDRALMPFMLLDQTAKQFHDVEIPVFDLEEVSVGVLRKNWTQSGREIVMMYTPNIEVTNTNAYFTVGEVPVIVWFIEGDYQFFRHPDVKFYYTGQFYLPNPFREYWKNRDYIK